MRRLTVLLLLAACNTGPYPGLAEILDPAQSLGGGPNITVMRDNGVGLDTLMLGRAEGDERGRFAYMSIENNELTTWSGEWSADAEFIDLWATYRWVLPDESDKPPTQIVGTVGEEVEETLTLAWEAGDGVLRLDGDDYEPIWTVQQRINPNTREGALDAFAFYHLALHYGTGRVDGFGGAGMAQYFGARSDFVGLIEGVQGVELDNPFSPLNSFYYEGFQDLSGVRLTGEQYTKSDMAGDGHMYGVVSWTVNLPPTSDDQAQGEQLFLASADYGDEEGNDSIIVEGGWPSDGEYTLTVAGNEWRVGALEVDWSRVEGLLDAR